MQLSRDPTGEASSFLRLFAFSLHCDGPNCRFGEHNFLKVQCFALVLPALLASTQAGADPLREVQYGSAPDWILPAPSVVPSIAPTDAPFRIEYQDSEDRVTAGALESFHAYRIKILKPEALPLGNINLAWSPGAGHATVHYVRVIRDNIPIDVLKDTKFRILERETGLEQSVLDGNLTASLQVPGLEVGDELEFAGTITRSEPVFGNHAAGLAQIPATGFPGTFRYRLLWPRNKPINWRLTKDLPAAKPTIAGSFNALQVELQDPPVETSLDGAPLRYNVHQVIEYSDYPHWSDVSKQLWPAFDVASRLQPNSPIRAEAAKIAIASADPIKRTEAALRLVQDQIRYVFVGLDGGNYKPAAADETWLRRFGDCKAKTVLLLALLRELRIKADPVLVNSKGGDGMNERLPNPGLFDHVLVRASVGNRSFWLDGTRLGDRYLDMLPQPEYEWGLPLTSAGSELVSIAPTITSYPQTINVVDVDSSAGFAKEATWTLKNILHGDEAFQIRSALSTVSKADADRLLKSYWHQQASWVEPRQVDWRYDERHAATVLTLKGEGKVEWKGDDAQGHRLTLPGGGFYAPAEMDRPRDQDQSAAWAVEYPRFRCWVTTIHLPPPTKGFHWTYSSNPVDRRLAGVIYWRRAGQIGNLVRTVMSRQSFVREISAAEAARANKPIPAFDNYMSSVDEEYGAGAGPPTPLPFTEEPDWAADPAVCSPGGVRTPVTGQTDHSKVAVETAGSDSFAKGLPPLETLALPAEQSVLKDLATGIAAAGSSPVTLLEAGDKALAKLSAPTKLRGFVQFIRASALSGLKRDLDAVDAIQESIRLLPNYSAPLIAASSIYAYLDRGAEGVDYLFRAIDLDPQTVRTVDDYEINNLMHRLDSVHDEGRIRSLSDRLLKIGWLGTRLGSQSGLAVQAIKEHANTGDLAGARAFIPKLLVPNHSYSLLMQNEYRALWPEIETWAGPQLGQRWTTYLNEAQARWSASKSVEASLDYLSALRAARHYKTAVREVLPLLDKPDKERDYELIFAVNSLAEALAHLGRWKDGESLFDRAQSVWPITDDANALNIAANYAVFLLTEGRADEGLKRLDETIGQARKWGPEVGKSALASMYHYRACMLHELGRDAEAGVSMAMAAADQTPASVAALQLCLGNPQAAKKVLIAGLGNQNTRDGVIDFVQLPAEDPLPSEYSRKMRARLDALRTDSELLQAVAKYGRVVPWAQNAGAPPEAP